jgi:glutaredoxin 3
MRILIYSSLLCPYCFAAKKLLRKLNLNYQEILIDNSPEVKNQMIRVCNGRKTVPQVFFGNNHVGGYDDLKKIYEEGKISSILEKKNEN